MSVSEDWTRVMLDAVHLPVSAKGRESKMVVLERTVLEPRRQVVEGLKRTMKVGPDAGSNDVPEKS